MCVTRDIGPDEITKLYQNLDKYSQNYLLQIWNCAQEHIAKSVDKVNLAIMARISNQENFQIRDIVQNKINEMLSGWAECYERNETNDDIIDSVTILVINADIAVDYRMLAILALAIENRNAITLLNYILFKTQDIDFVKEQFCRLCGSITAFYPRSFEWACDTAILASGVCEAMDCKTVKQVKVLSCLVSVVLCYLNSEKLAEEQQCRLIEPMLQQLQNQTR